MPSPKEYLGLLKETIRGIHESLLLSIDQIGTDGLVLSVRDIERRMRCHEKRLYMAADYLAHYPSHRQRLEDFIEIGMPEYALDYIVRQTDYLKDRNQDIITPLFEDLLQAALAKLEEKYSRRKVGKLKKRLGIDDKN